MKRNLMIFMFPALGLIAKINRTRKKNNAHPLFSNPLSKYKPQVKEEDSAKKEPICPYKIEIDYSNDEKTIRCYYSSV